MNKKVLVFIFTCLFLSPAMRGESAREASQEEEVVNVVANQMPDETQLELATIRLHFEQGKYDDGLDRLEALSRQYPNNIDLRIMKAQAEFQLGKWIAALNTVEEELAHYPDHKELLALRKEILSTRRPYISIAGEYRKVRGLRNETFAFLNGRINLGRLTYLGMDLQHDYIDAKDVVRPKTGSIQSQKAYRSKGDVFIEHFFNDTHSVKGGIYGAQSIIGGHLAYTLTDSRGHTTLAGKFRQPYWDYSETVIYRGTRDKVSLARLMRFSEAFSINMEGGFNNYNVDRIDNVVQSGSILARSEYNFFNKNGYTFLPGKKSSIGVAYTFDAEYPYHVKNRINSSDEGYPVLAITRAEEHAFELNLSTLLFKSLEFGAFGGYSLSRFNKNIPFAGANLGYTIEEKIKLGIEYEHRADSSDRSATIDRVKAEVTYLFQ